MKTERVAMIDFDGNIVNYVLVEVDNNGRYTWNPKEFALVPAGEAGADFTYVDGGFEPPPYVEPEKQEGSNNSEIKSAAETGEMELL